MAKGQKFSPVIWGPGSVAKIIASGGLSGMSYQLVKFDTQASFGSTNAMIPNFTNTTTTASNGDALFTAVASSATLGHSITILRPCLIYINYTQSQSGSGETFGISKNATALTTAGQFQAAADTIKLVQAVAASSSQTTVSTVSVGAVDDVFRGHSNNPINITNAADWQLTAVAIGV